MFILAEACGGGVHGSGRVCVCMKANSVVDEKSEVNQCRSSFTGRCFNYSSVRVLPVPEHVLNAAVLVPNPA